MGTVGSGDCTDQIFIFSTGVLKIYDVARILSILSAPVKQELASSLLHVLSVVQQPKTSHLQQYEQQMLGTNEQQANKQMLGRTSNFTELDWKAANSIDTGYMQFTIKGIFRMN